MASWWRTRERRMAKWGSGFAPSITPAPPASAWRTTATLRVCSSAPTGSTFISLPALAMSQEKDSALQQAWYVPYGSGEAKKIGNDLNDYNGVSIANDGASLVTVQIQTLSNVYVLPPDGRIRQLVPGSGRYFDLAWAPDGRI